MRRLTGLVVVMLLVGAITAVGASASASETDGPVVTGPPSLACDVAGGAILWEHPNPLSRNPKLINSNTAIATSTPVAAGKYDVASMTWDGYWKRQWVTQLNEQWFIDVGGVTTAKTSDVPDMVISAWVKDDLGTYTFPEGELVLLWAGQRTDSVIPSAVCLTPVEEEPPPSTTTTTMAPIPLAVEASCEAVSVTGPEDTGGSVSFIGEGQLAQRVAFDGLPVTVVPPPWTGVIEWSVSANGSVIDSGSLGVCKEAPPMTTTTVAPTTTTTTTEAPAPTTTSTEAPVPNGGFPENTGSPWIPLGTGLGLLLVVAGGSWWFGTWKERKVDNTFR